MGGEVALLVEQEVLVTILGEADTGVLFGGGFLGMGLGVHEECLWMKNCRGFGFK